MAKKLIILNGPPRSGKDTGASHLWRTYTNVKLMRMSQPLKDGMKGFFGWSEQDAADAEAMKDKQHEPRYYGKTWREWQISMSEDWIKKVCPPDTFGRIAWDKFIRTPADMVIFSDGGFNAEWQPFLEKMRPKNILVIRIYRDGCSYQGDSRGYIDLPSTTMVNLTNNATLKDFHIQLTQVTDAWLATLEN